MFDILETCGQSAVIKVIGVGGGGGNAIEHMVSEDIEGVEFIVANTDAQALDASTAALGQAFSSQLAAASAESAAAQADLRAEISAAANATENASRQRVDEARRQVERLHEQLTTRLQEAEHAIENGTIEANALADEVRRA